MCTLESLSLQTGAHCVISLSRGMHSTGDTPLNHHPNINNTPCVQGICYMLNNCCTFASCIISAMNCVCGRVSDRKRGKGSKRRDCSSAPLPAQQELFLDPQKQRSRIAFHPPCNYCFTSKCGT